MLSDLPRNDKPWHVHGTGRLWTLVSASMPSANKTIAMYAMNPYSGRRPGRPRARRLT